MKTSSLVKTFLLLFFTANLCAQNQWSILPRSNDTLLFSDKDTNLIWFFADSVDAINGLRTIYPSSEFTIDSTYDYFGSPRHRGKLEGEGWLGSKIYESAQEIVFIIDDDSLVLSLRNQDTSISEVKGSSITAINQGKSFGTLYDGLTGDSIMTIKLVSNIYTEPLGSCLNQTTIILSKHNGLLSFPACFKRFLKKEKKMPDNSLLAWVETPFFKPGVLTRSSLKAEDGYFAEYNINDELHYVLFHTSLPANPLYYRKYILKIVGKTVDNVSGDVRYQALKFMEGRTDTQSTVIEMRNLPKLISSQPYVFQGLSDHMDFTTILVSEAYQKLGMDTLKLFEVIESFTSADSVHVTNDYLVNYYSKSGAATYAKGIGLIRSDYAQIGAPSVGISLIYYKIGNRTWGTPYVHSFAVTEIEHHSFKVYPNPTEGILKISLDDHHVTSKSTIEIFDLSGKRVYEDEMETREEEIDISSLKKGVYMLQLNGRFRIRVVKL